LWDGLKGYTTNTKLAESELITHYTELWHIEKAFRMSKTDLKVRPIYHRLEGRIRAHMSIVFTAYCIYKTLETALKKEKSTLSLEQAAELTKNMYQVVLELPGQTHTQKILLGMDEQQQELLNICKKYFRVTQR
ncbi:MAG: transposase, partial [Alcaligenaceae bacterium]|nr:transposase [Alcaligenaceae bacterium]